MLEKISKIIAISISAALIVSLIYDYFFLSALDISFAEVPSSLQDHVRSAILWVPSVASLMLVSLISGIFALKIIGATEKHTDSEQLIKKAQSILGVAAPIVIGCFAIYNLLLANNILLLFILLALLALYLASYLLRSKSVKKYISRNPSLNYFVPAFALVPIYILLVCYYGSKHGLEMKSLNSEWKVAYLNNDILVNIDARGIRRFSTFLLAVDTNYEAYTLPENSIVRVYKHGDVPQQNANICEWFGYFCN